MVRDDDYLGGVSPLMRTELRQIVREELFDRGLGEGEVALLLKDVKNANDGVAALLKKWNDVEQALLWAFSRAFVGIGVLVVTAIAAWAKGKGYF